MKKRTILAIFSVLLVICPWIVSATVPGDIDADGKIDLPEAVHALQVVSGTKEATGLTIQQAINSLPADGGTVFVRAGVYSLTTGIHINQSNVALKGEQGNVLVLARHVNQPVILIGTAAEAPNATHQISNIRLCNLEINGNKSNQDSEFHHNFFNGIVLYAGQDMPASKIICYENGYAGISLGNKQKNVCFDGGVIGNNGDVGIFARDSEDIKFNGLVIKSNGSQMRNLTVQGADSLMIGRFYS